MSYTIGPQVIFECDDDGEPKTPMLCRLLGHDWSSSTFMTAHLASQGYGSQECRRCGMIYVGADPPRTPAAAPRRPRARAPHTDDAYDIRCPDCGYPFTGGHDYVHEQWLRSTGARG